MIVRVRRNKTGGLSKYLRDGVKKDSNYSRNEKDIVTPIWGNLDEFEKIEDYILNENSAFNTIYNFIQNMTGLLYFICSFISIIFLFIVGFWFWVSLFPYKIEKI